MTRNKKILSFPIGLGLLLFFSWRIRGLVHNPHALFWLGFLTSFGAAFTLPLVALLLSEPWEGHTTERKVRQTSIVTFLLLTIHEGFDILRKGRVFDLLDIAASAAGALAAYLLYKFLLAHLLSFLPPSASHQQQTTE